MDRDRIERDTFVKATPERVWAVITEPQHVGVWFGQGERAEIDLRPGGIMRLDHGQYGVFPTVIVAVEPPRYFAYRWASGFPNEMATANNATLVEFFLEPEADGTRLRVIETGFASVPLPSDRVDTAGYDSHDEGWRGIVEIVRAYAEK